MHVTEAESEHPLSSIRHILLLTAMPPPLLSNPRRKNWSSENLRAVRKAALLAVVALTKGMHEAEAPVLCSTNLLTPIIFMMKFCEVDTKLKGKACVAIM